MKKILLLVAFEFILLESFSQIQQQPNSTSPSGKRSWAGTDSAGVYTFVEQNPEFPGGDRELIKLTTPTLNYPQMERDNHIEGTVLVRFVITEDGTITNPTVTKRVSPGLDKEALRIVKNLPRFVPGRQNGKPVKTYFNLPVVFKL